MCSQQAIELALGFLANYEFLARAERNYICGFDQVWRWDDSDWTRLEFQAHDNACIYIGA